MTVLEAMENLEKRGCSLNDFIGEVKFFQKEDRTEHRVKKILRDLGVPEDMDGLEYLSIIIEQTINHETEKHSLEYFYYEMAKTFKKQKKYVQNQIRKAIQIAANSEYVRKYVGTLGNPSFIQPKKFVDGIVDYYKVLVVLAK